MYLQDTVRAIMAVPAHDSRDYAFAKHFGLEIRPLVEGCDVSEESFDAKEGIVCNSHEGVTPIAPLTERFDHQRRRDCRYQEICERA